MKKRKTICHVVQRLADLCRSCSGSVDQLSDLFDRLEVSEDYPEIDRLADIIDHRLAPIIHQRFSEEEQVLLEKTLKTLVILRVLELPYRPGSPILSARADDLLATLHRLCGGDGLMTWQGDDGEPVYVIERDTEQFIDWLLARQIAFLGRREREKAISDGLWAMLVTKEPAAIGGVTVRIEAAPFAKREAILIQHHALGKRVVVFESPWEEDQGRRAHRVIRRLPEDVTPDQVWVWLPASPDSDEERHIICYIALAQALRRINGQEHPAIPDAMVEPYLRARAWALRAIVGCYRRGTVVTERGMWRPNGHQGSLVSLIENLVAWGVRQGSPRRGCK